MCLRNVHFMENISFNHDLPLGLKITPITQAKNSGHRVTWVRRTGPGLKLALSGSIALDPKYHEFSTFWKSSIFQAK